MTTSDTDQPGQQTAPSAPVSAPPTPVAAPAGAGQVAMATVRKAALTSWEGIWYVLMCIALGYGYLLKIPPKKALQDFGLVEMTSAERTWYTIMCIPFGAAYFAKIPMAKALSELPQHQAAVTGA